MKKSIFWLSWIWVFALVSLACAQAAAPAPSPAPAPQAAPAVPAPSPEEAAWAKAVEAARKEGMITIYGSSQFAGEAGRRIIGAFSDKYGIRVEMLNMPGRQTVERVKIESRMKQPIADIAGTGLSSATELSLAGLLHSIAQELPELRNRAIFKMDPVYTPNGDMLNMAFALTGAAISTKLVKAQDEPRSYLDLLDPKWKGKIILTDPRGGGGGGFQWFSTMRYYKALDDDYFRRFARQEPIIWGGSATEQHNMIARGEAWLNPETSYSTVGPQILEGAPLKLLGMAEGSSTDPDPIAMVKGPAHPNAAKLFINWIFTREGQEVYARARSVDSMRKDVPNFVDPRVRPQPEPQKILPRTYEMAQVANQYHKEGIAESIFGKR